MTLQDLTSEDKAALLKELENQQKAEKKKREDDIEAYKGMQDDTITSLLPRLVTFSVEQKNIVEQTFADFGTLVKIKQELFSAKDKQDSHTFTSRDGMGSITIGHNTIIGFDGTEAAGIQLVKQYIATMSADDDKRKTLGDLLNTFMKPDKKGNLNPTRIAELVNKKAEINDEVFTAGIDTIVGAQFKTRTSTFVRGWQRIITEGQPDVKITFSITA